MAQPHTWYEKQATVSKILVYMAILGVLVSVGGALYIGYQEKDYRDATIWVAAGIPVAAIMIGLSAIIDLLIVHAEALRDLRK